LRAIRRRIVRPRGGLVPRLIRRTIRFRTVRRGAIVRRRLIGLRAIRLRSIVWLFRITWLRTVRLWLCVIWTRRLWTIIRHRLVGLGVRWPIRLRTIRRRLIGLRTIVWLRGRRTLVACRRLERTIRLWTSIVPARIVRPVRIRPVIRRRLIRLRTIWLRTIIRLRLTWHRLTRRGLVGLRVRLRTIRLRAIKFGTIVRRGLVARLRTTRLGRIRARPLVHGRLIAGPIRRLIARLVRRLVPGLISRPRYRGCGGRGPALGHLSYEWGRRSIRRAQLLHFLSSHGLAGMLIQHLLPRGERGPGLWSGSFRKHGAVRNCLRWSGHAICRSGVNSQHRFAHR
jgi:hypothetical protein